jgi:hypothetical protein
VAASLNCVELIGRLGDEPEVTQLAQAVVCRFRLATNTQQHGAVGEKQEGPSGPWWKYGGGKQSCAGGISPKAVWWAL